MRKLISLLLCVTIFMGMGVVGIGAESLAEYVANDEFQNLSALPSGWTGNLGKLVDAAAPDSGKVLNMGSSDQWDSTVARTFTPQSGEVLIQTRLKFETIDSLRRLRINEAGTGWRQTIVLTVQPNVPEQGKGHMVLSSKRDDTLTLPGGPFEAGQWFNLNMLIDTVKGRATAWIGDEMPQDIKYVALSKDIPDISEVDFDVAQTTAATGPNAIQAQYLRVKNLTEFTMENIRYEVDGRDYSDYESLIRAGEGTVSAYVKNNSGSARSFELVGAVYSTDERLVSLSVTSCELGPYSAQDFSVVVDVPDDADAYRFTLMAFDQNILTGKALTDARSKNIQTYQKFAPANIFSDGMVLQREQEVAVFGKAQPGREITVEFDGQVKQAVADETGDWCAYLDALAASSEGKTMTITAAPYGTSPEEVREYTDVVVGEVWLASGQSNMELALSNMEVDTTGCDNALIRFFSVTNLTNRNDREKYDTISESWQKLTSSNARGTSAICYFFATQMQPYLDVPVGIIQCYRGATTIETWMDAKNLTAEGTVFDTIRTNYEKTKQTGTLNDPGVMFENKVETVRRYGVAGIMWYQGESNAGKAADYEQQLPEMIAGWRRSWGDSDNSIPFFVFQLPKYKSDWSPIREAQYFGAMAAPNTEVINLIDTGLSADSGFEDTIILHPRDKDKVAAKMVKTAKAVVYGEDIEYTGPRYRSHEVVGSEIVLQFDHVGGGLVSLSEDQSLPGFEICGSDGRYSTAEARIEGDTVVVSSSTVTEPVAVRYAWSAAPALSLGNAEGEPALAFRTDRTK